MTGRVVDGQGLSISEAYVELQDGAGKRLGSVNTDATGAFRFASLGAGTYQLRVLRAGFEAKTSSEIKVAVGEELETRVTLETARVYSDVTVLADNDRLVASRTEVPLRELPVTVQTVGGETLRQQAVLNLVDAVKNVPNTNSFTLYGMYEYYVFRGFGFDNVVGSSVLLDGLRLEGNRMNTQLNSIQSVEVLKGPSSMLYGTEATGGTINLVRKKPTAAPAYEGVVRGGRWGMFGAEFGAAGPIRGDKLLYRLDVGFNRAHGFRQAGWDRFNVTPAIHYRMTNRDQLNFYVTYNEDRFDGDAGIPLLRPASEPNPFRSNIIPNVPFSTRYTPPTDFQATRDIIPQMFYTHTFSDNLRFRNAFTYRYFDDQYLVTESLSVDPVRTPDLVDRGFFYFFHHRRPLQNQMDLLSIVRTGKVEHQILFGYDYLHYANQTERSGATLGIALPPLSIVNPRETFTQQLTNFPVSRLDYFTNNVNAFFFQDFMRLNSRLTALVSGRYDRFRRTDFRNPVVNGVEGQGAITRVAQDPFTWRAALNGQVTNFMSIYGSYGTSFRPQTSVSNDGRQLEPETGDQYEIGQRFDLLGGRMTLNTSLFWINKENVTVSRANGVFDQAGRMRAKGWEADLRGRMTRTLQVMASYGFTQSQFKDFELPDGDGVTRNLVGRTPAFVPKHTARLWAVQDLPKGWAVAVGPRYVARAPVNNFNYYFLGGYTLWDAAVFYKTKHIDYSVNINNLFNKERYLVASINDFLVYPGRPFDLTANLRFRW
ncbi:MAG: TonB-dependent receptor [Bryobacter sp.]|nr:TonB-dependent receptor [Bryobacter sp.]